MTNPDCIVIGAQIQDGASQPGCLMGPDGFRTAGLLGMLGDMGLRAEDRGNIAPAKVGPVTHPNSALRNLDRVAGWTTALIAAAEDAAASCTLPIFMGGDHSISNGTVPGIARHAAAQERPLFVLWLDAHPDLHSLDTTTSGNLHGVPVGYFTGQM